MTAKRTATLYDRLRESGLLEPPQLEDLGRLPEAQDPDPRLLGKAILQRGWLTRFQVNSVANGRGKDLFIGPYLLLDRVGEGGMGQVYKAKHRHMSRIVALKVIRKEKLAHPDAVKRFYQEAQAAAQLAHPNIVLAYDAGQAGGTHYLAMEFVDGVDLARLVKERGPLPVATACDYARQAALGLQHAHERGMVHRDIKPHNLLVTASGGVVKILDMGLARLQGAGEKDRALTQTGAVIGTPEYLSPEQAINSRMADIRSDLYSLGCTLYFLLTGKPPFQGESLTQVLLLHQTGEAESLARYRTDIPAKVQAVARKMIAREPDDRYQTPIEAARALEPFCQGNGADAPAIRMRENDADPPSWAALTQDAPREAIASEIEATQEISVRRKKSAALKDDSQPASKRKPGLSPQMMLIAGIGGGVALLVLLLAGVAIWIMLPSKPRPTPPDGGPPAVKSPVELPAEAAFELLTTQGHTCRPGDTFSLTIQVKRLGFQGPIDITLRGLPQTVQATASQIPAGADSGGIKVTITREANPSELRPQVVAQAGQRTVQGNVSLIVLKPDGGEAPPPPPLPGGVKLVVGESRRVGWQEKSVARCQFSLDGSRAVLTGGGSVAPVFDLTNWKEIRTLTGKAQIYTAGVLPDNRHVVVSEGFGVIALWDVETGQKVRQFLGAPTGYSLGISADGKRMVTGHGADDRGGKDHTLRLWDVETGREQARSEALPDAVLQLAFSADGRRVVTLGNGRLLLWDVDKGPQVAVVEGRNLAVSRGLVSCPLAISADGRRALICEGKKVWFYDLEAIRELHSFDIGEVTQCAAFSPDGRQALVGTGLMGGVDGPPAATGSYVWLLDLEQKRVAARFEGHTRCVLSVAFAASGRRALSSSHDKTIREWDLTKLDQPVVVGQPALPPAGASPLDRLDPARIAPEDRYEGLPELAAVLKGHTGEVFSLVFAPDGKVLASSGGDGTFRLWDLTGTEPRPRGVVDGKGGWITSLSFSPDGKKVAIGTKNRYDVQIWDVSGPEIRPAAVVPGRNPPKRSSLFSGIRGLFSPDGKTLVVSDDTELRVLDLTGPEPVERPTARGSRPVGWIALSRDGRTVASTNGDRTLRLWDLTASPPVEKGTVGAPQSLMGMAFSPDGRALAAGCMDGTVCVWDLSGPEPNRQPRTVKAHQKWANSVAFSPDGKVMVSTEGGASPTPPSYIIEWDPADLRKRREWRMPERCSCGTFDPSGRYLALTSHNRKIYVLRLPPP